MSRQVDLLFIRNFEAEVYVQYQQMGSKLRNTIRTKNNVVGATTTFQPLGSDNPPVECELRDYFAGDWVDALDELKTNINEQQVVAKAGAYALGRRTDELIVAELASTRGLGVRVGPSGLVRGQAVRVGQDGLCREKVEAAHELVEEFIPDDGQRFAIVGWRQWSDLLGIPEFSEADYADNDELPWKGTSAKRWLGTLWIPHSGLPKIGNIRYCYWYHKAAIGHAIGSDVKTDITWHGDRAAHFVNNMMSQGACTIDASRVVTMPCLER